MIAIHRQHGPTPIGLSLQGGPIHIACHTIHKVFTPNTYSVGTTDTPIYDHFTPQIRKGTQIKLSKQ